jgi:hypothetical protein
MSVKDYWNEQAASEKKATAVELPEGTYTAEVMKCEFGKTRAEGDKVFWDLKVLYDDYANCHCWVHSKFSKTDDTEENKKDINKMLDYFKALDLPCASDGIAASMASIVGKTIEFKIVEGSRGGRFTNFIRVVPEKPAVEAVPVGDNGLPF